MNKFTSCSSKSVHPHLKASRLSKLTFWWLKDLFKLGLKQQINDSDLYETLFQHEGQRIVAHFSETWNIELKRKKPSVLRLLTKCYGLIVFLTGFLYYFIEIIIKCIQPLFLGALLSYFVGDSTSKSDAYWNASGIILCSIVPIITFHPFILCIFEIGMKVHIGCCGLVYKKLFKLPASMATEALSGKIINLMSNDIGRLHVALFQLHMLWKCPIQAGIMTYMIYREMGFPGIIGILLILIFIPIQSKFFSFYK